MLWIALALSLLIVILLIFAAVSPLGNGDIYRPSPETVRTLKALEKEEKDGCTFLGDANLELRHGLYVLKLAGSPYQMGYQHGALLKDQIRTGAVPYFDEAVENISPLNEMHPIVRWFMRRYFDWAIFLPLVINSPRRYIEELKGLADGCGLPFAVVLRGNMLSELSMCLGKSLGRRYAKLTETPGCTSFAAYGDITSDGDLIVGRNTDYFGVGLWDKAHTVMFYQPEDGYKFVNISSAGLIKCNTCMNEKGIFLGGHFMYSDDVSPRGVGFSAFELEIMKRAASIDEAFQLVSQNRRAGAFAYLIVDGMEKDAAVIEACANAVEMRKAEDDRIWQTNFATTDAFRPHDFRLRLGITKNPESRFERMRWLLDQHRGTVDVSKAARFMGDHLDMCSGSLRPSGHVIGTLMNLTSAVFKPGSLDFWVASGPAPAANNTFFGFNLHEELRGDPHLVELPELGGNPYAETSLFQALRKYYQAVLWLTIPPIDGEAAYKVVQELTREYPDEVAYLLVGAKMALKQGDSLTAHQHLTHAANLPVSRSETAQINLLLGYCQDLDNNRPRALDYYRSVIESAEAGEVSVLRTINPFVLAEAERRIRKAFNVEDAGKIEISPVMEANYDL